MRVTGVDSQYAVGGQENWNASCSFEREEATIQDRARKCDRFSNFCPFFYLRLSSLSMQFSFIDWLIDCVLQLINRFAGYLRLVNIFWLEELFGNNNDFIATITNN